MDILKAMAIKLPCNVCGGRYQVTLRQIHVSQETLRHEGCPVARESECPPAPFGPLVEPELIDELQQLWQRLEEQAHAVGGALSLQEP